MSAQLYGILRTRCRQFEKKVYDLKTSRTIAIQTAPQIRLIQNNDKLLADRIQTAIQETIRSEEPDGHGAGNVPAAEGAEDAAEITDTTNSLLLKNSEKLKQNTLEVAKESERGIVDVETLRKPRKPHLHDERGGPDPAGGT